MAPRGSYAAASNPEDTNIISGLYDYRAGITILSKTFL